MTILQSLAEWIDHHQSKFTSLADLSVVQMGESDDLAPPFLGLVESGAAPVEQDGLIMHGVTAYEVTAELHTVPAADDQEGTEFDDDRLMRADIYDILADRDAIQWVTDQNHWRVFDIRCGGPITEAQEGRRVTRWELTVIACPI